VSYPIAVLVASRTVEEEPEREIGGQTMAQRALMSVKNGRGAWQARVRVGYAHCEVPSRFHDFGGIQSLEEAGSERILDHAAFLLWVVNWKEYWTSRREGLDWYTDDGWTATNQACVWTLKQCPMVPGKVYNLIRAPQGLIAARANLKN